LNQKSRSNGIPYFDSRRSDDALREKRAPLCRECLDWSERRSHLAGSLGRAFLSRFEALSWARRDQKTRVVTFSRSGAEEFQRLFFVS
ncbi:MAG: hypothetical protein O3A96_10725, partial [Proteobacteria bacterium]|nr:hypothetical protein [Pseudomonadota bacterium]